MLAALIAVPAEDHQEFLVSLYLQLYQGGGASLAAEQVQRHSYLRAGLGHSL